MRQLPARASSGATTGGAIGQASPAGNELNWVYRGTLPVESIASIDVSAYRTWAGKHGYKPAEVLGLPLLGVPVPPAASVLLFEVNKLTSNEGNLAAFVQSGSGSPRSVRRTGCAHGQRDRCTSADRWEAVRRCTCRARLLHCRVSIRWDAGPADDGDDGH